MISLTDKERRKFSDWLEWDALQIEGLVTQMEKLPAMEVVIRHEKMRIMARRILAREFQQTETFTLGDPDLNSGDRVIVDCDQYHGPGEFLGHNEGSISVRISNGNVWNYPVSAVRKA